jgi:hypothetical protein
VLQAVVQNRDQVRAPRALYAPPPLAHPPHPFSGTLLRVCTVWGAQLKKAMEEMAQRLKAKELELLEHVKKHNIRQTSDVPNAQRAQSEQAPARSQGVLV